MKLKNTLLLLVLAGVLFAFIHFFESGLPTTQESAERSGKIVEMDQSKIEAIAVKNKETEIELSRNKDGKWNLTKPVADRANSTLVAQLLTTTENLKSVAEINGDRDGVSKDQLKEFGLKDSDTRLTLRGGKKPIDLLFGKDAAVEGKGYVRLEDGKSAYVVPNELKNLLAKKADDFRDPTLTDLATTNVDRVLLKTAAGEIELNRKDQHWSLSKPLKARGDDQKIADVISQIANAQIASFVSDASNLGTFGLQEPRATVTLSAHENAAPVVVQLGARLEKDQEKIYAKTEDRHAVVVLPKSLETILELKPNSLRDRNLVRIEADIVDRMTIEGAGAEKIVLARKGESWVRKNGDKDEPLNAAAATRLLSELPHQQVTEFVSDLATELPKYGLAQPSLRITLSSYASENTAETKSGEKPIVSILFGRVEGDHVYAKLDDEPFVVSLPKGVLDFAMSDPLQWQPLEIYQHQPADIVALDLMRAGQPALSLERDKNQNWRFAKGDGNVNATNVESLVNTLSHLRAVRWVGARTPEDGLENPSLTVAFKTATGGSGKLACGTTNAEGLTFANADGLRGAFGMSSPDVTALQLPLFEKPAAMPSPEASPISPEVPPIPTEPPMAPPELPASVP